MTNLEEFSEIEWIKQNLKRGEMNIIASAVGCSYALVKAIFSGNRNHRSPLGRKIIIAAETLIEKREGINKEILATIKRSL